jgi:hypothetical protein
VVLNIRLTRVRLADPASVTALRPLRNGDHPQGVNRYRSSGPSLLAALPSSLASLWFVPAPAMTLVREAGPTPPARHEGVD